ncbi:MAG: hypothetical protein ACXVPU_09460 [Bacteroidia bacterium]
MQKNKSFITLFIMVSSLLCTNHNIFGQCKAKQIMKSCKPNVPKPYKYDSYVVSEFTFNDKEQKVEVMFTAFQGMKYRLIFCSSGFEEPVKMNIWDKSNRIKKGRNKVYDNSQGVDNNFWSFQPPKAGNYYIEYEVPKSLDGKVKKGCVVLLIGYAGTEDPE